jgi:hypothetical protein
MSEGKEMQIETLLKLKQLKEDSAMSLEDFKNTDFIDNRIVGLIEENNEVVSVVTFNAEKLQELNVNYKTVKEQFEGINFYHQKLNEDLIGTPEDNLALLEKHAEMKTKKQMLSGKNTRKSINSVRGADGRKITR